MKIGKDDSMGYKVLSDSTLMGMKKKDIIELLRCAEHNRDVAVEFNEQQYQNVKDLQPVKHGQWLRKQNPRWKAYAHDCCSLCGWCET